MFTNIWSKLLHSSILVEDISDHLPIIAWFDYKPTITTHKPQSKTFNLVTDDNKNRFLPSLDKTDWSEVLEACAEQQAEKA